MTITNLDDARNRNGRIPPHDLLAEQSLLGAMMLSKDAVAAGMEHVSSDDFYKPAHAHIYDAISTLTAAGEPVDPATVATALADAGILKNIGGPGELFELQANTPASTNAERYARSVAECALLRRLISAAGEIAEFGYEGRGDGRVAIDRAEATLFAISSRHVTRTTASLESLLDPYIDALEQLYEQGRSTPGLSTGFTDLDELLGGLHPGRLYVIGGRPSMGKTALALNVGAHVAIEAKVPVYVFSLEMSQLEVTERLVCADARVDSKKLSTGHLTTNDWERISRSTGRLADAPIWIDDDPNLTVMEIRAKARRLKSKQGALGLVIVDYLQLMSGRSKAENRQVEVAEMSRGLKVLARELECPVIALSQLSRGLESRLDKRPMLSDLRESGAVEQDADVVAFIYRDEVYKPDSDDRGTAEVIIPKQRQGPTGQLRIAFMSQYTKFTNLAKGGR